MKHILKKVKRFLKETKTFTLIEQAQILRHEFLYRTYTGKRAVCPYPPRYFTIFITGYCTNRCLYCCHHADSLKNHRYYNPKFKMDFNSFRKIVDMAHDGLVPHVHLCGLGEPLILKDFWKYADYVIEHYGKVSFQTNLNGTLMKRNWDDIIKRHESITTITTDAFTMSPTFFEKVKVGSSFKDVINIMSRLSKEANIKFNLSSILTRQNFRDIDKMLLYFRDQGIRFTISFNNLFSYGKKFENEFMNEENIIQSADKEILEELERAKAVLKKEGIHVNFPPPRDQQCAEYCRRLWTVAQIGFYYGNTSSEDKKYGNVIHGGCEAVFSGNFTSIGNLFDYTNVTDFWNNERLVKIRQAFLDGKIPFPECATCMGKKH